MRRLIGVELTRYRSRRAIGWLLVAAALLTLLVAAKTAWDTRPITAAEHASAQAQAATDAASADLRDQIQACLKDPVRTLGPDTTAADCRRLEPTASDYYPREALSLHQQLSGNGYRIGLLIAVLLVIAAATFAGADWASGSMVNQLVFEPRRGRVWLAKAAAVGIASAVVGAVLVAAYWIGLGLVADARGIAVPTSVVHAIAAEAGREVVLCAAAAVGGFALAMLFRNTVATLGLLFLYAVIGDVVLNLAPVDGVTRWSLGNNVTGWVRDHYHFLDDAGTCGGGCSKLVPLGQLEAGLFLLVLLAIAAAASYAAFRRRDV